LPRSFPHLLPSPSVRRHETKRAGHAVDIAVLYRNSCAYRHRLVAEHVAGRGYDRKVGPEVIEKAGSEREAGFDLLGMGAERHIRIAEKVDPLLVGHPPLVKNTDRLSSPSSCARS